MSTIPEEWSEPGSWHGTLYDGLWSSLAALVVGVLLYVEPFDLTIEITPTRLVGAALLGAGLGVGLVYGPLASDRVRRLWSAPTARFAALFLGATTVQVGVAIAPTWTLLTLLATFLATLPVRIAVYVRSG